MLIQRKIRENIIHRYPWLQTSNDMSHDIPYSWNTFFCRYHLSSNL